MLKIVLEAVRNKEEWTPRKGTWGEVVVAASHDLRSIVRGKDR